VLKKSDWKHAELVRTLMIWVAGIALAGPAAAGSIYSWQTQSGDVAFSDDIKNVPSRYREQVQERQRKPLDDYERFSSQESEVSESYADRLQARLVHLQGLNESLTSQSTESPGYVGTASLRIGDTEQVLNVTGGAEDEPVIVERIRVIRSGQIASRHDTVVRQGSRTLAIMRGNQEGEVGLLSNIVEEKDVELYR
jgi:hypothetical protein